MLQLTAACICDPGKFRRNNQDNFIFAGQILPVDNAGASGVLRDEAEDSKPFLSAVFDGMGGFSHGETAAAMAAEAFRIAGASAFTPENAHAFATRLNRAIFEKADEMRVGEMGTTVVAVLIQNGTLQLVNIGDSRAYLYRKRVLYQISEDHTNSKMLEALGIKNRKPELNQYLGMSPEVSITPYTVRERLRAGDQILLCSDGLYEKLEDIQILRTIRDGDSPGNVLWKLCAMARAENARDNLTAILIRIGGTGENGGNLKDEH